MNKLTDRTWVWILLLVGFGFRLIYFLKYSTLIEFGEPTVDALYHHLMAKSIAGGALTAGEAFFRAPFYNYFLGLIYWITSDSIAAARFVQLTIGAFSAPLVFLIARDLFDKRTALLASLFTLLCQDLVYFEGELLLESIVTTQILASLYLLLRFRRTNRTASLIAAGLVAGLAIITRPNAAVILLPLVWLIWSRNAGPRRQSQIAASATMIVAAMLPVALVLVHNLTREQPAFTLATQGGINFYIGNNHTADGVSAAMPGKLGYNWQYEDIAFLAEQDTGEKMSPAQVGSYYYSAAFNEIISDPLHWCGLLLRKGYLLFSGSDISNNRDLTYFKNQFFILKLLPIGMWLLGPLGLLSLIFWRRFRSAANALQLFVLLYGTSFILFFVNSRFRLPLLPLLSCLAAATIFIVIDLFREKAAARAVPAIVTGAVLLLFFNINLYGINFENRKQALFTEGNLRMRAGSLDGALESYRKADNLPGQLKDLHLNIGVAYLRQAEYDSAWKYLLLEDSLSGGSAEALSNLSYLYRQTKQLPEAISSAKLALEEKPYMTDARLNLWSAWREAGMAESVFVSAQRLEHGDRLSRREKFLLAVSAADLGRFDVAAKQLSELISEHANTSQPLYAQASSAFDASPVAPVSPAHLRYNLGYALAGLGQIDSAIVLFEDALELDPQLQEAWVNLGTAYLNKQRFSDAEEAYRRALEVGPGSELLYYNYAISLLSQGKRIEGENALQLALEINPEFAPAKALTLRLQESP